MQILRTKRNVISKFKQQLMALYYMEGVDIIQCFLIYLGFLIRYCNDPRDDKPLGQFTKWQVKDMCMSIHNDKVDVSKVILETMWLYTRRGGKTKNLTIIAVFFSLLGKLVLWRSSFSDQLNMAKYWFLKNPFVQKVTMGSQNNEVRMHEDPNINFDVIAPGKTQSRGVDLIILDEECCIFLESKKMDVYDKLRPSLADSKFKHFIHGTTPEPTTVSEMTYKFLKDEEIERGLTLVAEHPYTDCPWISEESIEAEARLYPDDPYWVELQYKLNWTVPGGKVFDNVIRVGDPRYLEYPADYLENIQPSHAGVDFNGGDIKDHYLIEISYNAHFIYVLREIKFENLEFLLEYSLANPTVSLELEDGLYNTQFTKQTKEMGLRCIYNLNWTGETKGDVKMVRVRDLKKHLIIIDRAKCPTVYDNLDNCGWDRKSGKTQIRKTKKQHGLDGLIHAKHQGGGKVHFTRKKQGAITDLFKRNTRLDRL